MKFHKTLISAAMTVAASTILLTGAGTASAEASATSIQWDYIWAAKDGSAEVSVKEHGDIIRVCDKKADGHAAYVDVFVDKGNPDDFDWPQYSMYERRGKGHCSTHRASDGHDYNLLEGHRVQVSFGSQDVREVTRQDFKNDH